MNEFNKTNWSIKIRKLLEIEKCFLNSIKENYLTNWSMVNSSNLYGGSVKVCITEKPLYKSIVVKEELVSEVC